MAPQLLLLALAGGRVQPDALVLRCMLAAGELVRSQQGRAEQWSSALISLSSHLANIGQRLALLEVRNFVLMLCQVAGAFPGALIIPQTFPFDQILHAIVLFLLCYDTLRCDPHAGDAKVGLARVNIRLNGK